MNYDKKKIVNDLINRFIVEYKKNDRSSVYGFTQRKMAYKGSELSIMTK